MNRLPLSLAALTLLTACQPPARQAEAPEPAAAPAPPAVTEALTPAQLDAAAFQAAWGAPPPVTASSTGPEAGPLTYAKATLVPLGGGRFALVSEGQGDDSHAGAGALAIHYLTRSGSGFTRTGAWPDFVDGGTFGTPPEWKVRTDLTPAPALVATGGGTWQGYTCSWTSLVELTPERPILRADAIPISYDSEGAEADGGDQMDGAIVPARKGQTFDVRYTGAESATVEYALQGETYKATSAPDLPSC